MKVLILDNYDSFVYNLAQCVGALGGEPLVLRNDRVTVDEVEKLSPERIIVSPGPGNPSDERSFGVCASVLRGISRDVPTLGVCLGHQGIGQVFGAKIGRAPKIMHGKTSRIVHDGKGVLQGVASPLQATRYHSLAVQKEGLPAELRVTALALDDAEIMGLRHSRYPIEGVQFHPESIMTLEGMKIVRNFIEKGVEV
ncbi:MAG: aminodeoxychorismate/anthranilate synthase component II [Nitrososphaerota archaeon]|jgi:anthranilate synthase component 2|nr:aminodeoxychorismate/anthranilate synthase component II [Nitrososphaerota archaeon]MDG6903215.1 aminodeoxychorismate/anthranilate synthase component II [Nitrososphaerota archaeon]MDG6911693.1 aminodeoxychorismate/anthranilate synthase component II [Nitrososphaerota archaeon]MDG6940595.1 aminodeoxychorismate/anthranilate synthase component II [Nitrososphaerota archaeon]MDG6960906.1 aminodeoxychorismate/anthranilate synthase component II [Nitrososphaerota archaeon]